MPDPSDSSPNGRRRDRTPPGLSPIVPGRPGHPSYSLAALRELIETQFTAETAARADILLEVASPAERRALLDEIAGYVLAVEAITVAPADRRHLVELAYRSLFGWGPLEDLLQDDTVSEIVVDGPETIHARRGAGPLELVPGAFDDAEHLGAVLQRALSGAGIILSEPFLETGLLLHGRPVRLSLIGPPVRPHYNLELRLHPAHPVRLEDLQTRGPLVPPRAAELLRAILAAGHGLMIVGDVGLGKTTLAGVLLAELATLVNPEQIAVVERAVELHLPTGAVRHTPPSGTSGEDFANAIRSAMAAGPAWLVVDELRGVGGPAESAAIWEALTLPTPPRCLWVFRGARQPDRLRSALTMLIRQGASSTPESGIWNALAQCLPFVVTLRRAVGSPRLAAIAAWHVDSAAPEVLDLRPLLVESDEEWVLTGARPPVPLTLPESFWG